MRGYFRKPKTLLLLRCQYNKPLTIGRYYLNYKGIPNTAGRKPSEILKKISGKKPKFCDEFHCTQIVLETTKIMI